MNFWIANNVWLIPLTPIVIAFLILAIGKMARMTSAILVVLGQVAVLTMSIFAFATTLHANGFRAFHNFVWFTFGDQALRFGFVLDSLAAANLNFIAFWRFAPPPHPPTGVMIAIFSIAISAAEAAVGLAMILSVYRHFRTTNVDRYDQLKG